MEAGWPKISGRRGGCTNHSSSQKTRLSDLSYGTKIWTDLSSVLSQCTRSTDGRTHGRTDRRTDRFWSLDRICIPCSAVKISTISVSTSRQPAVNTETYEITELMYQIFSVLGLFWTPLSYRIDRWNMAVLRGAVPYLIWQQRTCLHQQPAPQPVPLRHVCFTSPRTIRNVAGVCHKVADQLACCHSD